MDGRLEGINPPDLIPLHCSGESNAHRGCTKPRGSAGLQSFFLLPSFLHLSLGLPLPRWILLFLLLFFIRALFVRFSLCPFSFLRLCLCLPGVVPLSSYSLVLFNRVSPTYRPFFFFFLSFGALTWPDHYRFDYSPIYHWSLSSSWSLSLLSASTLWIPLNVTLSCLHSPPSHPNFTFSYFF